MAQPAPLQNMQGVNDAVDAALEAAGHEVVVNAGGEHSGVSEDDTMQTPAAMNDDGVEEMMPADTMDLDGDDDASNGGEAALRPAAGRHSSPRRLYGSRAVSTRFPRPNLSITRVTVGSPPAAAPARATAQTRQPAPHPPDPRSPREGHSEGGGGGGGGGGDGTTEGDSEQENEPTASEAETRRSHSPFATPATDPSLSHLREISSLASWTVSSYKPGCGVGALLNPSTSTFWQSDGPQPHLLNIHFFKLVRIVKLRVYLDFELDESYTPTKLAFAAGTHEYDAVEFAEWHWQDAGPKGWVDVDLSSCGSEDDQQMLLDAFGTASTDGDGSESEVAKCVGMLRCFFLQVRVLENHQNGKDTHVRGVQIFALDERAKTVPRRLHREPGEDGVEELRQGIEEADWMGEPEIR